jgi:hypothetical protein
MPSGIRVSPTSARFEFDVLDCQSAVAAQAPRRWRLHGLTVDGRRLLLDFDALAAASPVLPPRLTRATVVSRDGWTIDAEQGRFELGAVRLFVHEDVGAQAMLAVPPRPVPLGKRLFWRAVFALLATRAGRRWLERRAAA